MEKDYLKICVYNLENFYIFISKYKENKPLEDFSEIDWQLLSSSVFTNKPLKSVIHIAEIIEREDIDILLMTEVGGIESLENFNKYFLKDKYTPYLIEGNSDRGIDLGYLVKSSLKYDFEISSHKNEPLNFLYPHEKKDRYNNRKTHFFSRDVLELQMKEGDQLKMIFLLVHLKSKLDNKKIDPDGFLRRKAETNTLIKIYSAMQSKYPDIPIFMGGDFNGGASRKETSAEFKIIYEKSQLDDVLELCAVEPRYSHIYIDQNKQVFFNQIDFLFLHQKFKPNLLKADIYRYDVEIAPGLDADKLSEFKKDFPSDHFPLLCKYKI